MFRLKHPLRALHLRAEFLERNVRAIRGFTVVIIVITIIQMANCSHLNSSLQTDVPVRASNLPLELLL